MNHHKKALGALLSLLTPLVAVACSPSAIVPASGGTATPMEVVTEGANSPTVTPPPAVALELQSSDDPVPPPAGLVYRDDQGLWVIDADGHIRLLTEKADAVPSPDLSRAYLWHAEKNSLSLIEFEKEKENIITPEYQLNGSFTWADDQTILLGVYLSPEESDGPNYGHLASLDVTSGALAVLDAEHLMSSIPAQALINQTIAFSSEEPMLYSSEGGVRPFPADSFSGLTNVLGLVSPAWSPDGRHLAWIAYGGPFSEDAEATMGLAIYDLDTGAAALRLAFNPARWGATPPPAMWSPDGRWLALRVYANGPDGSGIWLVSADGEQDIYIPGVSGNANYQVWSPDGRELIYFDYADEDQPPYAARLIYDLESQMSYPLAIENGLVLLWLDPKAFGESGE